MPLPWGGSVRLTEREIDKLLISAAAELARKRQTRGLKLNHPEAVAVITADLPERIRDGQSVAEVMQLGTQVLTRDEVMAGVPQIKGGMIVAALMGDPNASIPTPEPVRYRPMFGALGCGPEVLALSFVSQAAIQRGELPSRLRRSLAPGRRTRSLAKAQMVLNDALPAVDVDPESYTVTVNGERITSQAVRLLPLAQRYFLF
jgi:urease gamma subunit